MGAVTKAVSPQSSGNQRKIHMRTSIKHRKPVEVDDSFSHSNEKARTMQQGAIPREINVFEKFNTESIAGQDPGFRKKLLIHNSDNWKKYIANETCTTVEEKPVEGFIVTQDSEYNKKLQKSVAIKRKQTIETKEICSQTNKKCTSIQEEEFQLYIPVEKSNTGSTAGRDPGFRKKLLIDNSDNWKKYIANETCTTMEEKPVEGSIVTQDSEYNKKLQKSVAIKRKRTIGTKEISSQTNKKCTSIQEEELQLYIHVEKSNTGSTAGRDPRIDKKLHVAASVKCRRHIATEAYSDLEESATVQEEDTEKYLVPFEKFNTESNPLEYELDQSTQPLFASESGPGIIREGYAFRTKKLSAVQEERIEQCVEAASIEPINAQTSEILMNTQADICKRSLTITKTDDRPVAGEEGTIHPYVDSILEPITETVSLPHSTLDSNCLPDTSVERRNPSQVPETYSCANKKKLTIKKGLRYKPVSVFRHQLTPMQPAVSESEQSCQPDSGIKFVIPVVIEQPSTSQIKTISAVQLGDIQSSIFSLADCTIDILTTPDPIINANDTEESLSQSQLFLDRSPDEGDSYNVESAITQGTHSFANDSVGGSSVILGESSDLNLTTSTPRLQIIDTNVGETSAVMETGLKNQSSPCIKNKTFKFDYTREFTPKEKSSKERLEEDKNTSKMCEICGEILGTESDFNVHYRTHFDENSVLVVGTEKEQWSCEFCSKSYRSKDDLERHYKIHTENRFFSCKLCDKVYRSASSLQYHLKTHEGKKCFVCDVCGKSFLTSSCLQSHMAVHALRTYQQCEVCDKKFVSKANLQYHMAIHLNPQTFVCEVCGKVFARKAYLQAHKLCHSAKNMACKDCGKMFSRVQNLKKHILVHTGARPHQCHVCGRAFAEKGNLNSHLRLHAGIKPHECKECSKKFATSSELKVHSRSHTGETPYECKYCTQKFKTSGKLSVHLRGHTGERPYVCKYCEKSFKESSELNSHTLVHTGERRFPCKQCGKTFQRKTNLKVHMKVHNKVDNK